MPTHSVSVLSRQNVTGRGRSAYCHIAKIAGNFMIGCAIEMMAESAALICLNGGDPGLLLAMLGETLFDSFIRNRQWQVREYLRVCSYCLWMSISRLSTHMPFGTRTPFVTLLREQLQLAEREGYGREDLSTALASVARFPASVKSWPDEPDWVLITDNQAGPERRKLPRTGLNMAIAADGQSGFRNTVRRCASSNGH